MLAPSPQLPPPPPLSLRSVQPLEARFYAKQRKQSPFFASSSLQGRQVIGTRGRGRSFRTGNHALHPSVVAASVIEHGVAGRIGHHACVGALGALVAAFLQAFTEPVLNRIAVKRMTVGEAIKEVRLIDILRFFRTVLATNLLKFPFFEVVNIMASSWKSVPVFVRGIVAAVLYTSAMLPFSNYRYIASVQGKVKLKLLYNAYWPTLLRDLMYGVTRSWMMRRLTATDSLLDMSPLNSQAWHIFLSIGVACLVSSPGNELRAYRLQHKKQRLKPSEFFQLSRFLRSALLGALIPAISIAVGQLIVGQVESIVLYFRLGALWLMPRMWGPLVLIMVWILQKLQSNRPFYESYYQSRMLRRFRETVPGTKPRLAQAATFAKSDPANYLDVEEKDTPPDTSSSSESGSDDSAPRQSTSDEEVSMPTAREIFKFVAPSFCVVVANSSMTSVDKAFLGRSSTLQLASMGPAASVFDSSSFLLTFLNTATLSLLGMSAGDEEKTRKIRSHAIFLATSAGLILGAGLFVNAHRMTRMMGATTAMMPFSATYLRIRALGTPIERGTSVSTSFCLAAKDGSTPLQVTLVGLALNVFGDWLLCPRYGLAGVAVTSVVASLAGYVYLIVVLVKAGRWPSPFSWPRGRQDMIPFLKFAGPVLFAVFLKTMTLANMTAAACSLGTSSAAAHQIFQTLFLLSAVALGNPFSWAAQAFLPPLVAAYCNGKQLTDRGADRPTVKALLHLIRSALASSFVASLLVVGSCRHFSWLTSSDPAVIAEMVKGSWALVPFLSLYPVLLTLEGALYGTQERGTVLRLSLLFWWMSSTAIQGLKMMGKLSLSSIWLSVGIACAISTAVTAIFAFRSVWIPKCYLFNKSNSSVNI